MSIRLGIGNIDLRNIREDFSWSSYWTQRGKVIFTMDADTASERFYTKMYPIAIAKNMKFTIFHVGTQVGTVTHLSWDQVKEMQASGLVDNQCHTFDHTYLDTLNEAQILAELTDCNAEFTTNGMSAPTVMAYPGGAYNKLVKDTIRTSGLRKLCRRVELNPMTEEWYTITRDSDKFSIPAQSIDKTDEVGGPSSANIKAMMDAIAISKEALVLYYHNVNDLGGVNFEIMESALIDLIDYAQALDLRLITFSELYEAMLPENIVYPDTEFDELTITSAGTGAGVTRMYLTLSRDVTITLTGNARFYSDAAGTLDESATWFTRGRYVIYVKCTAGTSTMSIPRGTLLEIYEWAYIGTAANCPRLGGDISGITSLTMISTGIENTLYGSITNLINLITLNITGGTGIITGDVSNLINLTYFNVSNASTVSGDVTLLTKLTRLQATGAGNTLSGSISGMTVLNTLNTGTGCQITGSVTGKPLVYIKVVGTTNTINGDITGMALTSLWVEGLNTITGAINFVNATYRRITGSNTVSYISHAWKANSQYFLITPAAGHGWSIADISQAIIDASATTWIGLKGVLLATPNSSMADTTQGGIWGDFSGPPAPSALAIAYKTLKVTLTVTVTLVGIVAPGGVGDGTGFPAGFGDWYRS